MTPRFAATLDRPRRSTAVVGSLSELRDRVRAWRAAGESIALVATMGALHRGHLALMEHACDGFDRVITSIFVNPTQFAPDEDFTRYPRTLDADLQIIGEVGVDVVWLPSVGIMYPDGFATSVVPQGPAVVGLDDVVRPGHFNGVATVVMKLFNQVQPDAAIFGEKDFQQLAVIRHVTGDLDSSVAVIGVETVREPSGLALSSRNRYLSEADKSRAPLLHATLVGCAVRLGSGASVETAMAPGWVALEQAGFRLDYLEARNPTTLKRVPAGYAGPLRLLVAAHLGATRLIDNIAAQVVPVAGHPHNGPKHHGGASPDDRDRSDPTG